MTIKKLLPRIILIAILSAGFQAIVHAQPSDPGDDPDKVPLDPGSWVLVAAGVGYGVKKWKENKQTNKNSIAEAEDDITK